MSAAKDMNVPDKLVTAGTEAAMNFYANQPPGVTNGSELVKAILAAAFAALPDCEIGQYRDMNNLYRKGWADAIAALARMGESKPAPWPTAEEDDAAFAAQLEEGLERVNAEPEQEYWMEKGL